MADLQGTSGKKGSIMLAFFKHVYASFMLRKCYKNVKCKARCTL